MQYRLTLAIVKALPLIVSTAIGERDATLLSAL